MHRTLMTAMTAVAVALSSATAFAQAPPAKNPPTPRKQPLVEFELMTWPEVKQALADGRTTALVYTGGTACLHRRHRAARSAERERRTHADGAGDRQDHRAPPRQRDRDAGASLHAEQRERRSSRHDRPHAGTPRRDPRADHRADDDDRLQERRHHG